MEWNLSGLIYETVIRKADPIDRVGQGLFSSLRQRTIFLFDPRAKRNTQPQFLRTNYKFSLPLIAFIQKLRIIILYAKL
jgi:hypothetical protein